MVRLLLVDDDESVLAIIKRSFDYSTDMATELADCGSRALSLLEGGGFQAVVSDLQMPGMDGPTFLRTVALRYPHMLRIVLSGHPELETEIRSTGIAHHYFSKPCSLAALESTLRQALLPETAVSELGLELAPELKELVPFFLERRLADLSVIRQLLAERNFEGIRVLGHNMKGSATSYGFPELTRLGGEMESAAKNLDASLIERQAASMEALLLASLTQFAGAPPP